MSLAILSRLDKIEQVLQSVLQALTTYEEPVSEIVAAEKMGIHTRTLQNKRYRGEMDGTFIINKAGRPMYYMSKVNTE